MIDWVFFLLKSSCNLLWMLLIVIKQLSMTDTQKHHIGFTVSFWFNSEFNIFFLFSVGWNLFKCQRLIQIPIEMFHPKQPPADNVRKPEPKNKKTQGLLKGHYVVLVKTFILRILIFITFLK